MIIDTPSPDETAYESWKLIRKAWWRIVYLLPAAEGYNDAPGVDPIRRVIRIGLHHSGYVLQRGIALAWTAELDQQTPPPTVDASLN